MPEQIRLEQESRKNKILEEVNVRNLGFFDQEIIKLDGWSDDLKNGLEVEIREIDKVIKEARKSEPPRVSRRPNFLREYPNEKYLLT